MKKMNLLLLGLLAISLCLGGCGDQSPMSSDVSKTGIEPTLVSDRPLFKPAPGTLIATVPVPNASPSGIGIGVAVNCEDPVTMFYTNSFSPLLHKMTSAGADLGSVPLTDAATGASISFGAISWDESRKRIWAGTARTPGGFVKAYLINPTTGVSTFIFTLTQRSFDFCDGIGFDGTDNSIWVSDDVSTWVEHWDVSGVDAAGVGSANFIGSITPKNAAGGTLGAISGVTVGKGDLLYLGQDGRGEIVQVTKSGTFIAKFATAAGRDEDLECDLISFAPLEVIWSKDAFGNFIEAFEVEPGTCVCGGGGTLEVPLDIKPQSCPNPLNVNGKGNLPVAILGTDELDVNDIDVSTVQLEGVDPIRSDIEDVATPVANRQDDCDCTTDGPDGFDDLTLKFDNHAIVAALGPVNDGDEVKLTLTGNLNDGTAITGLDCVVIKKKK